MAQVLVLCYHAVSERWPADLSVTPAALERQLGLLVRRGYRGTTFHRAVTDPPARRTLAVTFDDAYRSVLRVAKPILDSLGLPATVFIPSEYPSRSHEPMAWPGIDQWLEGPHRAELHPMSWPELASLRESGWELGSHTRSHPRLTGLDERGLDDELAGSRATCQSELGIPCRSLAYPYGDHDARVVEAARRAGYEAAGTLPARFSTPTALAWPRVGIYHGDRLSRFRLKVSPGVRRLRSGRLWPS